MKQLFAFIWRYHYSFVFLFLEAFAIMLVIGFNNRQHNAFTTLSLETGSRIHLLRYKLTRYLDLRDENTRLLSENARLRTLEKHAFTTWHGNDIVVNDTIYHQKYVYIGAHIIQSTLMQRDNILIINRGRQQGIQPGMAVVCDDGIAGIIRDVTSGHASVISILSSNTRISVKLKGSNFFGFLVWDGEDPRVAQILDLPRHANISIGDTLVTRGGHSIFPAGVSAGIVQSVELPPGQNFYNVTLKLSTDFYNIGPVYVVKNLMREELDSLQERTDD